VSGNNPGATSRPLKPGEASKDLWQIIEDMINEKDKPRPQEKEFFGTIRKVLERGNTGFQDKPPEEKMRFKNSWPKRTNWPIYALVEVPFMTARYKARGKQPKHWEYNFLTVDITKMGQLAEKAEGKIIVFTFDSHFNHPTFSRYPSNKTDDPSFAAPPPKPKPPKKKKSKAKKRTPRTGPKDAKTSAKDQQ